MKKTIPSLLLLTLCSTVLASCGCSEAQEQSIPSSASEGSSLSVSSSSEASSASSSSAKGSSSRSSSASTASSSSAKSSSESTAVSSSEATSSEASSEQSSAAISSESSSSESSASEISSAESESSAISSSSESSSSEESSSSSVIKTYRINFDLDGGSSPSAKDNIDVTDLEDSSQFFFDVTKSEYKFKGWSYEGTQVFDAAGNLVNTITLQDEMTFKAIWLYGVTMKISYNLFNPTTKESIKKYDALPEEIGSGSKTAQVKPDTDVDLKITLSSEYEFIGWYSQGVLLSPEKDYKYKAWNEDFALEARFRYAYFKLTAITDKKEYGTVRIGMEGGEDAFKEKDEKTQFYTESVTVCAQASSTVRFIGWYDEDDNLVSYNAIYNFKMPKEDYTLYAKWNNFKVEYDLQGGVNDPANPSGYGETDGKITLKSPSREGYKFTGWTLKDSSDELTQIDSTWKKDISLVAHWTPDLDAFDAEEIFGILTIFGVKDEYKTAKKLYVPTEVGAIWEGAFKDCHSLEELTLPFVGFMANNENGKDYSHFAYIFGADEFEGGVKVNCIYVDSNIHNYVPSSLKKVTILGGEINDYAFYGCNMLASISLPERVTSIGKSAFFSLANLSEINIPSTVKTIGSNAFRYCSELTDIALPSGLTSLGSFVFSDCDKLSKYSDGDLLFLGNENDKHLVFVGVSDDEITKIKLTSDTKFIADKACYDLAKLTEVDLPDGLLKIGNYAFQNCVKLKSLTIPNSAIDLGYYVASGCSALTSIVFPKNLTLVPDHFCENCTALTSVTLPEIVAKIDTGAFASCESLSYIALPETLGEIGAYGFRYNKALTSITLPEKFTTLGINAFEGCEKLTSIALPEGIEGITASAFEGCSALASVTLPKELKTIGTKAFYGTAVSSLTIPNTVTSIGTYAFAENKSLSSLTLSTAIETINGSLCENCTSLASITIPANVTEIGNYAFAGCTSLATLSFASGSKLTRIGAYAFKGDAKIGSTTLPGKVQTIANYAFAGCSKLNISSLPSNLETLGAYAFNDCTTISTLTLPTGVTTLDSAVFKGCTGLTSLTLHSGLTVIATTALQNTGLKSLYIPANVETYYSGMLSGCKDLAELSLPFLNRRLGYLFGTESFDGAEATAQKSSATSSTTYYIPSALKKVTVRSGALVAGEFANCVNLTTITLPNTLPDGSLTIPAYCFYNCTSLVNGWYGSSSSTTAFSFPSVTKVNEYAFYNCKKAVFWFADDYPITSIGTYAFYGCAKLNDTAFHHITSSSSGSTGKLTSLGAYAFASCTGLYYIDIRGNSLSKIQEGAFYNCNELVQVRIYAKVTTIEKRAFSYCDDLRYFYLNTTLTTFGDYALAPEVYYTGGLTIYYAGTETQWGKISKGTGALSGKSGYYYSSLLYNQSF